MSGVTTAVIKSGNGADPQVMNEELLRPLIVRWRTDPEGTYQSWFLWEERIKNFRSIRRGLQLVVEEIRAGTFGNAYRDSSLEVVVGSIAEQRQIFRGADHAFLWKPKLRIPDIYEDRANQLAFAQFLDHCSCCTRPEELIAAIHQLDARRIKGLGPAAANLLYFLHPTFVPPFNTAIVNGYNALTGAKVKLGKWTEYLAMRQGILRINDVMRDVLSNDLGAVAGLLFDLGSNRYSAPPLVSDAEARQAWLLDLQSVREAGAKAAKANASAQSNDRTHTDIQGWLRDLGLALGYQVWIAANDRGRIFQGGRLGDGCLADLPVDLRAAESADTIRLIDVLWLDQANGQVCAAFEVEHSTSIYSGIVRMLDLALGDTQKSLHGLFLVAPDDRQEEVCNQLRRPAFRHVVESLQLRYLPYGDLSQHREAIARFGAGLKGVLAISKVLT